MWKNWKKCLLEALDGQLPSVVLVHEHELPTARLVHLWEETSRSGTDKASQAEGPGRRVAARRQPWTRSFNC